MIGVNWNLKFRLQQELFNKQITYLRDKNARLHIRNQHLERRLHEQANNAGRRGSSRSKAVPSKEKVCKVFRIY
jgi:regulator of replication initiation timing